MDLLELRMAFEVHTAELAAPRRSWAQEAKMWEALKQLDGSQDDEAALDQHENAAAVSIFTQSQSRSDHAGVHTKHGYRIPRHL